MKPITKTCRICHKPLDKSWKWLERPFYSKLTLVCPDCFEERNRMINLQLNSNGGKK